MQKRKKKQPRVMGMAVGVSRSIYRNPATRAATLGDRQIMRYFSPIFRQLCLNSTNLTNQNYYFDQLLKIDHVI